MTQQNLGTIWRTIEGEALYYYHRTIALTIRWQFEGKANLTLAQSTGRPILWAYWHENVTPFILYAITFHDPTTFSIILVGDVRLDILGRLTSRMKAHPFGIDMQGNPMESGRKLLRVIQAMKRGNQSMLAPDGPDGPPFEPKKGVAFIAKKAKAVVIPVGIYAKTAYRLKRWDKYQVPLPFSRMQMVIGTPILPDRKSDDAELLTEISDALTAARQRARQLSGILD